MCGGRVTVVPLVILPPDQQWDQALLLDTLARCPGYTFEQCTVPIGFDGAVVVVPGRYDGALDITQAAIEGMDWCVVMVTGDEASVYPWQDLKHERMRLWVQTPRPQLHEGAGRFFGVGYTPHTRPLLRELGPHVPRTNDWCFAGQVSHKRRKECVEVLRGMDGGVLVETPGFTQGLPHAEYARLLASTRVVACPSGPATPDTFRVWEALEAGCIPVADGMAYSYDSRPYWRFLFGEDPPFPVVLDSWQTFPGILAELLDGWDEWANAVQAWWIAKKREMALALADDLAAVMG